MSNLGFIDQQYVRGCVLDSPFGDMKTNVRNFVDSKAPNIPDILIDMALAVIDTSVFEKTGIKLSEIKPDCYFDGIDLPVMLISGDKDELVKPDEIRKIFLAFKTKVKRLHFVPGGHADDRSTNLLKHACKFCKTALKQNQRLYAPASRIRKALVPVPVPSSN